MGFYHIHGNVWEWMEDYWHNSYEGVPTDGSAWLTGGDQSYRALRGGSWDFNAEFIRSAYGDRDNQDNWNLNIGFRLVLSF